MKKVFLAIVILSCLGVSAYGQNSQELIGQLAKIYKGSEESSSGLIGGFSVWGLAGGFLFGSVGFIAFVYGKKNSEIRLMLIGIALMVYPYFLRGTLALFLVGSGLIAALYFLRD